MRNSMFIAVSAALLTAGCASQPPGPTDDQKAREDIGRRVDSICTLPEAEREAAVEQLKKETGMVLYCGKK